MQSRPHTSFCGFTASIPINGYPSIQRRQLMSDEQALTEYILPDEIRMIPVSQLPAALQGGITAAGENWVVAKQGSRYPSQLVSKDMVDLLSLFRSKRGLVDAVL